MEAKSKNFILLIFEKILTKTCFYNKLYLGKRKGMDFVFLMIKGTDLYFFCAKNRRGYPLLFVYSYK